MDQRAHTFSARADGSSGEQVIRVKAVAVACLRVLAPKSPLPIICLQIQPSYCHSVPVGTFLLTKYA